MVNASVAQCLIDVNQTALECRPIGQYNSLTTSILIMLIMVFFVIGILFGAGGFKGFQVMKRRGKSVILWLDNDAMKYKLSFVKTQGNEVHEGDRVTILDGKARLTGELGSLWMIVRKHGHNLLAPSGEDGDNAIMETDKEMYARKPGMRMLTVCNPQAYWEAIARNEAADALNANRQGEPWYAKLAPVFLILGLVVVAGVIFLVFRAGR